MSLSTCWFWAASRRARAATLRWKKPAKCWRKEFPEIAGQIKLHVPDEKSRRIGQAVAAASLPSI